MRTRFRTLFVALSLGVTFFSCGKHTLPEELLRTESLMLTSPDSALALLESIPSPEKMGRADYAEYCLLLTEARDKNYYAFTSDSVMRVAVEVVLMVNPLDI